MTESELIAHFDLFLERKFLDAETCERLLDEMRQAQGAPATVYGSVKNGSIEQSVRRVTRLKPTRAAADFVKRRLWERRREIEENFQLSFSECEEPQFLRYMEGDFFVAHQDGNTGLLKLDSDNERKVSVVIFLNRQSETVEPDTFCGGSLVLSDFRSGREIGLFGEAGALVAFRSETTHEVKAVTHGERYTIACWYR